ncbi:hypothetical protein FRB96_007976 [Tulasnella sp. 330]|nr:hypothetical protein FRB96_007976 [Tulasnella sp. 330]
MELAQTRDARNRLYPSVPDSSIPAHLKRALRPMPERLCVPTVRQVVLNNVHTSLDLLILLSTVPNATSLALNSLPDNFSCLTGMCNHPPPHPIDNQLTSVTVLTIFGNASDLHMLRTFVEAKLPALWVMGLHELCMAADLEVLKDRVEVRFMSEQELELEESWTA